jgi:4-amino-4-deoxy-L-arabinose transferase-like glycosyltransferase
MEEPSVLDYLKSKLNPWSRETIEIPPTEDEPLETSPERDRVLLVEGASRKPLPWRALLALALALVAQSFLEPPAALAPLAALMYALALGFLGWAAWAGEWAFPRLREENPVADPGQFRGVSLVAAVIFAIAAFVLFLWEGNRFTSLNVIFWLAAMASFVHGLWLPGGKGLAERLGDLRNFFARPEWYIPVTRWSLLLLAVWGIALFFRFSEIDAVPAQPFSDHAEKLLDVHDLTEGQYKIFFERNTGREFIQFYLTAFVGWLFGTDLSFLSLKIGTALIGFLTLPYIYLLGKEVGNKRIALFALAFAAIAYWPNVISRVGLRYPLYPLFVAPVLFYLLRGLRTQSRNDFILAGLFLGLGLHGYSPFRFVPLAVLVIFGIYLLHQRAPELRQQVLMMLSLVVFASTLVFLPLLAYGLQHPGEVAYRSLTRLAETERAFPGPPLEIFFDNLKSALLMFNYDNGNVWVHSVSLRPALDVISAALFTLGFFMLLARYLSRRDWRDLTLLVGIPLLLMPSVLSLAFPAENPALNRAGGAYVIAFVMLAFALDGLFTGIRRAGWRVLATALVTALFLVSAVLNYGLVFERYANQFRSAIWNTSDISAQVNAFELAGNSRYNAWVIPYPHWVDTRLVGVMLGDPTYDPVLWPDQVGDTVYRAGNKLFFIKQDDLDSITLLRQVYPQGALSYYRAAPDLIGKDFWVFSVADNNIGLP